MQSRRHRDEKTLQIVEALLVFVGALSAGSLVLVVGHVTLGLRDSVTDSLVIAVVAAAGCLAAGYLAHRTHRP